MAKFGRSLLFAGMAALAAGSAGSEHVRILPSSPKAMAVESGSSLSVMTYNIKGLPWPIASGREEALGRIAARLVAMRRTGRQPHIVLLQEAFTTEAASLATRAGYGHVAMGPDADLRTPTIADEDDVRFLQRSRWDRGEQMGKPLGSGLMILSDYPITGIDRMTFPDFACAGFDCLANKGVLIAHLDVAGIGQVSVVNAHLNARKAAMVPIARSLQAYRRQVGLMAGFVARRAPKGRPLIVGGDMNIGKDRERRQAFFAQFAHAGLPFVTSELAGAQQAIGQQPSHKGTLPDLAHAVRHGKDWLFARGGDGVALPVLGASVPFGSEAQGAPLSDHMGYVIRYASNGLASHEAIHFASGYDQAERR